MLWPFNRGFTLEAQGLQALGDDALATRVVGRDGVAGDQLLGEPEGAGHGGAVNRVGFGFGVGFGVIQRRGAENAEEGGRGISWVVFLALCVEISVFSV